MSDLAPILFTELLVGPGGQVLVVCPTAVRGKSMMVVLPAQQAPPPVLVDAEPPPSPLPPLQPGLPWQVQVVFLLRPFLITGTVLAFMALLYLLTH